MEHTEAEQAVLDRFMIHYSTVRTLQGNLKPFATTGGYVISGNIADLQKELASLSRTLGEIILRLEQTNTCLIQAKPKPNLCPDNSLATQPSINGHKQDVPALSLVLQE